MQRAASVSLTFDVRLGHEQCSGAAGCRVLHLPRYSPDFNPIEMAISKMKRLLRSLAQRTVASLMKAIDTALRSVTAAEPIAFIQHCRYAATAG